MYAPQYPFAPGPNAPSQQQPPPQQPGYIHNPAAQQSQMPQSQMSQQQQQQQQQQMMFNSQQQGQPYTGGIPMAGIPQQAPYGPGMNAPNLVPNPNAVMMQNGAVGMPHMAAGNNGIASYQTPYNNSPYGMQGTIPSSGPPQQQIFLPPNSNTSQSSFVQAIPPQRMHTAPLPQQHMNTPQRGSPYGSVSGRRTTPPHTQAPSQFMPPQTGALQHAMPMQQHHQQTSQPQLQQAHQSTPQTQSAGQTPVTPSFPNLAGGPMASPLSPGSEVREKERVSLLLDINRVLLMEVMRLQAAQAEAKAKSEAEHKKDEKKEEGKDGEKKEEKKDEKEKEKPKVDPVMGKEFVECMRRIQYNLSYLAAIADRSHKPSSQIPPHPAVISAPLLTPLAKAPKSPTPAANGAVKSETNGTSVPDSDEDRAEVLKKMYKRLQELFPGVDPTKEPPVQGMAQTQAQAQAQAQGAQKQAHQAQAQLQTIARQQPMHANAMMPSKQQMVAQMGGMSQAQKMEYMQRQGLENLRLPPGSMQAQMGMQQMGMAQNRMAQSRMGMGGMGGMGMPGMGGAMQGMGIQQQQQQGGQGMEMPGMGMGVPVPGGLQMGGQGMGGQPPVTQGQGGMGQ